MPPSASAALELTEAERLKNTPCAAEPALAAPHAQRLFTPTFLLILVMQASFGFGFSIFFLLPKFLTTELGAGPHLVGYVTASGMVAAVAAVPLLGRAIDRYDRRVLIVGGGLVSALCALCFIPIHSVGFTLLALRAVQGVALALVFNAAATLVADLAPPARMGQALGLLGVSSLLTNAAAPALAEIVASSAGWPHAFGMAAGAALVCAAIALFLPKAERGTPLSTVGRPVYGPRVLRIFYAAGIVGVGFGTMFTFTLPFAIELGAREVSGFFIGYTLSAATLRIGFGGFVDRAGRQRIAVAALAIYSLSLFAASGLRPELLTLLGALLGVGHGLVYPALNAMVVEGVRGEHRGSVMTLFNGCFNAGVALSTLVLGNLAKYAGFPLAFAVAGVLTLSGVTVLRRAGAPRA